mmetsp:Transcript_178129/g.565434  ORF Transcript_178129/g.565434 Transcript_178129/m.565434 type:complete len:120 (+) Transcript_178129:131-490(+)
MAARTGRESWPQPGENFIVQDAFASAVRTHVQGHLYPVLIPMVVIFLVGAELRPSASGADLLFLSKYDNRVGAFAPVRASPASLQEVSIASTESDALRRISSVVRFQLCWRLEFSTVEL